MRFELDLIRTGRPAVIISEPMGAPPGWPPRPGLAERMEIRRKVREATDGLIHEALRRDDMAALVRCLCQTMLTVAQALDRNQETPELPDFIEAALAHIEDGRAVMDRGLQLEMADTTRCGAVMLEITVRGICAALGIDYETAMRAVHAGQEPPTPTTGATNGADHDEGAGAAGADVGGAGGAGRPENGPG